MVTTFDPHIPDIRWTCCKLMACSWKHTENSYPLYHPMINSFLFHPISLWNHHGCDSFHGCISIFIQYLVAGSSSPPWRTVEATLGRGWKSTGCPCAFWRLAVLFKPYTSVAASQVPVPKIMGNLRDAEKLLPPRFVRYFLSSNHVPDICRYDLWMIYKHMI